MKEIFHSESAVSAFYREGLPYIIVTTEESVDFIDPKSQKLISSVKIKDAGICDVSDSGRYVAASSVLGVFLIDTEDNNRINFFNHRSDIANAYFASDKTLVVCGSWLEDGDINDISVRSSHTSIHYIDTETFKEIGSYSYPDSFAADYFKSGNEIFIHLQPRVDESHEDFEAMEHFLYAYLLRIDCKNPCEPQKSKIHNVDKIYDYNSINQTFLISRPQRNIFFMKPIEIVGKDMQKISKLPSRMFTMHACFINGGRSIVTMSAGGIREFDSKSLKQIAKINGMASSLCNHGFDDPYIGVFTANGAVLLKSEY